MFYRFTCYCIFCQASHDTIHSSGTWNSNPGKEVKDSRNPQSKKLSLLPENPPSKTDIERLENLSPNDFLNLLNKFEETF
ncbi:hypothetical protein SAMN04489724_2363 [Algoriphagus locisalis]|uniref:Uncharacterized protein n=1 Tax=Algoriphagus locisalis TaxID=305507 RepID=A0A1I7BF83_9BACT|nr:hypothetical protein [Algoriphagus locisalis]SFT85761.1 hypothetical protein SAMN04489724_2363 [Algoriphagus locisalis]